jgi:DNA-binding transcriptional MocR family regulator
VEAISDLPMLDDMDADYSPQYVKLARIVRDKIKTGEYKHLDSLPGPDLANEYGVSVRVAWAALAMLAANRYVNRSGRFAPYRVIWQAMPDPRGQGASQQSSRANSNVSKHANFVA